MDLQIKNQLFIVGGATSGFGRAISNALIAEGAHVIAVARSKEKLEELKSECPDQVDILAADITEEKTVGKIMDLLKGRDLHGILLNAGGPPARTVLETNMEDWDQAYKTILRWKVSLLHSLIGIMKKNNYGRVLTIESASVKQPMENLVLSTSLRLAVVGFIKTVSQEESKNGITFNVLAPGYHTTAAMDRLVKKKTDQLNVSAEEILMQFKKDTKVGFLGSADDFASLAIWLLSPHSRFITGQTVSVDGGVINGIMG
jgi:3-oxoacyl-[acyl-carrier protein] reductase